ncbi:hypothetical protein HGM15179_021148, partial [Zosterops borbonicus]
EYAMNYWKNNGAPAEKLLVGFPTYGKTFTLQSPSNHGIGAPSSGPGPAGPYTREAGLLAYYENNFGGAMVWTIDLDDFTGTFCHQGKYPLISSLKKGLGL